MCVVCLWREEVVRCGVSYVFDVARRLCTVNRWVAGGLFMDSLAANVRKDLAFEEEGVSEHVCSLLAAGGGGKIRCD